MIKKLYDMAYSLSIAYSNLAISMNDCTIKFKKSLELWFRNDLNLAIFIYFVEISHLNKSNAA